MPPLDNGRILSLLDNGKLWPKLCRTYFNSIFYHLVIAVSWIVLLQLNHVSLLSFPLVMFMLAWFHALSHQPSLNSRYKMEILCNIWEVLLTKYLAVTAHLWCFWNHGWFSPWCSRNPYLAKLWQYLSSIFFSFLKIARFWWKEMSFAVSV